MNYARKLSEWINRPSENDEECKAWERVYHWCRFHVNEWIKGAELKEKDGVCVVIYWQPGHDSRVLVCGKSWASCWKQLQQRSGA